MPFARVLLPLVALGVIWLGRPSLSNDATRSTASTPLTLDESRRLADEAESLYRAGRMEEVVAVLEPLHDAYPDNDLYIWRLAEGYRSLGDRARAAAMLDLYIDRSPVAWEACPMVGDDYWEAGLHREAVEAYRRCRDLEPDNPDHMLALALAHERLGENADASELFAEGVTLDPDYLDFRIGAARLLIRAGRSPEAELELRNVLSHDPGHADGVFALGLALERQGRYDEASEIFELGLERSPEYGGMALGLARSKLRTGDAETALRLATEQLDLRPEDVDAMVVLALAHEKLGSLREARRFGEQAIAAQPEYGDVYLILGRIAEADDRPADALALYDRLLTLDPQRREAQHARARAERVLTGASPDRSES